MTHGLGPASRETGGADIRTATEGAAMAVVAVAMAPAGCQEQLISEKLYNAVYDRYKGRPMWARMISDKLLKRGDTEITKLLDDERFLQATIVDVMRDAFVHDADLRRLSTKGFANDQAHKAAIEHMLSERMRTDRADGRETVGPSPSAEHDVSAHKRRKKKKRSGRQHGACANGSK